MMSNLDINGGARLIWAVKGVSDIGSNLPFFGLAAAKTAQRVLKLALIPALEIEIN